MKYIVVWKDSFQQRRCQKASEKSRRTAVSVCRATTDVINSSVEDSLLSGSDKDFIIPNLFFVFGERAKDVCVRMAGSPHLPPHTTHRTAHAHNNKQQHDAVIIFYAGAAETSSYAVASIIHP